MFDIFSQLNYLAVTVSAILYFGIGAAWYSPALFANPWMKLSGVNPNAGQSGMARIFATTFVAILIGVLVVAYFVYASASATIVSGLFTGLLAGIGLVATTIGVTFMYESRPLKLFLIDAGYHLTGLTLAAIILSIWR